MVFILDELSRMGVQPASANKTRELYGCPEEASRRHVVFKLVKGRVEVLTHPDFSLRTPKRGTRLRLREGSKLEGSPIRAGDHRFLSLVGLIDEAAELLLGVLNTDLVHGEPFRSVAAPLQWKYAPWARSVQILREVL